MCIHPTTRSSDIANRLYNWTSLGRIIIKNAAICQYSIDLYACVLCYLQFTWKRAIYQQEYRIQILNLKLFPVLCTVALW